MCVAVKPNEQEGIPDSPIAKTHVWNTVGSGSQQHDHLSWHPWSTVVASLQNEVLVTLTCGVYLALCPVRFCPDPAGVGSNSRDSLLPIWARQGLGRAPVPGSMTEVVAKLKGSEGLRGVGRQAVNICEHHL